MKRMLTFVATVLFAVACLAQNDVTKFLGIPVDGSKKEMIKALKKRGFKPSKSEKDVLQGEFNGSDVNVYIVETNNKVSRIFVYPLYTSTASDVIVKYNNLCGQFLCKDNYVGIKKQGDDFIIPTYEDISIPSDEDISYEMSVNGKRYEAEFIQLPAPKDSILKAEIDRYNTENLKIRLSDIGYYVRYYRNSVWFRIEEHYGRYYIMMFYDNEYNRANGEDL